MSIKKDDDKKVNKKVKFKKMILVLTIISVIIVTGAIGGSYAYYSLTNTDIGVTTKSNGAGQVIFSGSDYINMAVGVPIEASDVQSLASKSVFTVIPPSSVGSNHEFAFSVSLSDIYIDDDLMVEDFKYELKCVNNSNELDVSLGENEEDTSSGDATAFTDDSLLLGTYSSEDEDGVSDYNTVCTLYVWLEDSGENQNDLMGLNFSALIKVNTAVKFY